MSTAARKARKRAGEKFVRSPKVPTPFEERSYVRAAREQEANKRLGIRPMKVHTRMFRAIGLARRNQGPMRRQFKGEGK